MSNNFTGLAILLSIVGLLVGGLLTYVLFPQTVVETKTITKEVPVEKIVEVPTEKIVIKEVVNKWAFRDEAVTEFYKNKVLDDNDLLICNGDEYDFDQISLKNVEDKFTVVADDNLNYVVTVDARLRYKQSDVKQCYNDVSFSVAYEEDEKPVVEVL